MKKFFAIVLSAALLLMGTQANAQLSFGAGYLNSTMTQTSTDKLNFNGLYLGGSYNIHLVAGLGVAPGLYYSMVSDVEKGGFSTSFFGTTIGQSASTSWTEHALNIPINFNYGFDLSRDTRVFLFAGPTLQFGLASTIKESTSGSFGSGALKHDAYADYGYGRFNCLLGGGVGFDVASFQITIGYDYGLVNLLPKNSNVTAHRSFLKIGVAYLF